jgi:single-strand DNA-binding protein
MAGLNKVMLIGHLGRDPEMHYTPDGIPVTSFSLAVKRDGQDSDGGNRDVLEWFNIVAWRQLAETCNEQLEKGECIYVEGQLQTRTWEEEDGQENFRMEIIARDIVLLSNKAGHEATE